MNIDADVQLEEDVERVAAAIAAAIRAYPLTAQYRGMVRHLARVRAELGRAEAPQAVSTPSAEPVPIAPSQAGHSDAPPIVVRATPKFTAKVAGQNKSQLVLSLLRQTPRKPIREVAIEIFGVCNTKTDSYVRSILNNHRRAGRVRNVGAGQWEVVDT